MTMTNYNFNTATPFGQLPLLTWDGEELSQSLNLARFVGRMGGLAGGEDDVAAARSGMMLEHYSDLYTSEEKNCMEPVSRIVCTNFAHSQSILTSGSARTRIRRRS